jgi:hypothetical protein
MEPLGGRLEYLGTFQSPLPLYDNHCCAAHPLIISFLPPPSPYNHVTTFYHPHPLNKMDHTHQLHPPLVSFLNTRWGYLPFIWELFSQGGMCLRGLEEQSMFLSMQQSSSWFRVSEWHDLWTEYRALMRLAYLWTLCVLSTGNPYLYSVYSTQLFIIIFFAHLLNAPPPARFINFK